MNIQISFNNTELKISVDGRLDTITYTEFDDAVVKLFSNDEYKTASHVTLDLLKLEYISSAGLKSILKLQKELNTRNIGLSISNPNDLVLEVLSITGIDQIVKVE